jgi:hypothetical protein
MEAAKRWNASRTSDNKQSIELPANQYIKIDRATGLWDSPNEKAKKKAHLAKGTQVQRIEGTGHWPPWVNITVTAGPHAGKTGWVKSTDLRWSEKQK